MPPADQSPHSSSPALALALPFVLGGLSGMGATCIIQPIDMVKVRMQLGAQGGMVRHHVAGLYPPFTLPGLCICMQGPPSNLALHMHA